MKGLRKETGRLLACLLTGWIGFTAACAELLNPSDDDEEIHFIYNVSAPAPTPFLLGESESGSVSGEVIFASFRPDEPPEFTDFLPWGVSVRNRFLKSVTVTPELANPATLSIQAMSPSEAEANLEQGPATWATRSGVETGSISVFAVKPGRFIPGIVVRGGTIRVDVVIDPEKAEEEARIEPDAVAVISIPAALQFDAQSRSTRPMCLGNRGLSDLRVDSVSISSSDFRLSQDDRNTLPLRIPKGRVICLGIDYLPVSAASSQADIRITSNDPATPVATIRLEGTPNE